MLIAHLSDTHLGYRQYKLDEREEDIYNSFKECINKIIEIKPDIVIHCGDLFHSTKPPIRALRLAISAFRKLKELNIKTYIIPGNHEIPGRRKVESPLSLIKDYVKILDGNYDVINELFICGCKYTRDYNRQELLDKINYLDCLAKEYKKSIIMLHQGVYPYIQDYELYKENLPRNIKYIALGHLHNRILENLDNDRLLAVSGSTEIIDRREYEDYLKNGKGFYLFDYSKDLDKNDIERINIKCRDFVEVNIENLDDIESYINKIKSLNKPIVFGKVRLDLRSIFERKIKGLVLANRVRYYEDIKDIEVESRESIDTKKLLYEFCEKNKVDGEFAYKIYKLVSENNLDELKNFINEYYKSKF
ncbi:metallophosphoesterase family protein [Methanocaldococcus indicus]|uniref:metallophosphoesterase family protein n=1 Tax=Methanocaldococcus indicus TaxID=213231 RepID=UPI003C6D05F4